MTSSSPSQDPTPDLNRRTALTLAGGLAVSALAACTGGTPTQVTTTSAVSTSTTVEPPPPTTTTSATVAPQAEGAVFTGGPALGVKIDHTPPSYPRAGIGSADIVYVEPVEAELTRMFAVFSSHLPRVVGPVRSARESDLQLVQPFGPIAFAFGGGTPYTLDIIQRGPQVNLLPDGGFYRDKTRKAPYNLMGDTAALLKRAGGSVKPHDPGFRFNATQPAGGTSGRRLTARWRSCTMEFDWSAAAKAYTIRSDGKQEIDSLTGKPVMAANVVAQTVKVTMSSNMDVNGVHTPILGLVGSGPVTVLRGGQAFGGTWSRASTATPTFFNDKSGATIPVAPGPIWVLLLPEGRSPVIS